MNINHTTVLETMMFLSPVRVTNPAPVPETTLKLLHGVVLSIVPVHSMVINMMNTTTKFSKLAALPIATSP